MDTFEHLTGDASEPYELLQYLPAVLEMRFDFWM